MTTFGVRDEGFNVKGLDVILADSLTRAKQAFDQTIDLTATSPLRKLLEVTAAEDAELWKRMEDLYYGNFLSTAFGDNLNLLGEDLGVPRRSLFATGNVTFTLQNAVPGRSYLIPRGAVVVTAAPVQAFYTTDALNLNATVSQGTIGVQAFARGVGGNVAAGAINAVDPGFAQAYLNLGTGTLTVTNANALTGGDLPEGDEDYRARLLDFPRTMWTVQSVQTAALAADGVIDVNAFDPLGGVDVSQSYFNLFNFDQRLFSGDRRLGEPYFFTLVVAHIPEWPWRSQGAITGIYEQVSALVDAVRPIGIYPLITEADHIDVGVEATVIAQAGFDPDALVAAIKARLVASLGALKLGGDVLYSKVMSIFSDQAGVQDVQNLHLRRYPPAFDRFTFGNVPFQTGVIEAAAGENLVMGPTEIAIFRVDGALSAIVVVGQ